MSWMHTIRICLGKHSDKHKPCVRIPFQGNSTSVKEHTLKAIYDGEKHRSYCPMAREVFQAGQRKVQRPREKGEHRAFRALMKVQCDYSREQKNSLVYSGQGHTTELRPLECEPSLCDSPGLSTLPLQPWRSPVRDGEIKRGPGFRSLLEQQGCQMSHLTCPRPVKVARNKSFLC